MGNSLDMMLKLRVAPALVLALMLWGCGGGTAPGIGVAAAMESGAERDAMGVCSILSADQVSTVLPGHDGGVVAHSGGSMMKGVDSYQCSYTSELNGEYRVFTLVVSVAANDELMARIKPSGTLHGENQRAAIADGAFISDHMDDEIGITVIKGRKKADLDLLAAGAAAMRGQMLLLTEAVAAKL